MLTGCTVVDVENGSPNDAGLSSAIETCCALAKPQNAKTASRIAARVGMVVPINFVSITLVIGGIGHLY